MNPSDIPLCAPSTPRPTPMRGEEASATPDPSNLIALLHQIGCGGRRRPALARTPPAAGPLLALADSDGALAGLRIVNEILLAAERARQNGGPEHYVGDRVMEGLKLAALALTNHAIFRLHPE